MNAILFEAAVQEYYFLMNRRYPKKAALKLVGDRHRLCARERSMVHRGVAAKDDAAMRLEKLTFTVDELPLYIDYYNVVATVMSYLKGIPVFLGNDGYLRDCGEVHGRLSRDEKYIEAAGLFSKYIASHISDVFLYLDSPIPFSGEEAKRIRRFADETGVDFRVEVVKSPDYKLKRIQSGTVSTSDSAIISSALVPVFDIARVILDEHYGPEYLDFSTLLSTSDSL